MFDLPFDSIHQLASVAQVESSCPGNLIGREFARYQQFSISSHKVSTDDGPTSQCYGRWRHSRINNHAALISDGIPLSDQHVVSSLLQMCASQQTFGLLRRLSQVRRDFDLVL